MRERFAVALLDCPPALGPVSVNALTAADRVIVPVQAEYLALEGLVQFLETLGLIRRELNPQLEVSGLLITMHDERTRLAQDVEAELREHFDGMVFETVIPAQRSSRRVAELWSARDRARPLVPRRRRLPRPLEGAGKPWLAARRGIGRGLAAILPETEVTEAGELRELPVSLIKPNPSQPRTKFDEEALAALAASIEASGVVQPLLVRPLPDGSYELVAGERRWRAAQQAGVDKVPAVVRDQAEAERLQAALIENMVREDLNPVEEAKACSALVEELGPDQRRAGEAGRPQPPRRLQPDPPARAARRGAGAARVAATSARATARRCWALPATTSAAASPATPPAAAGRSAKPRRGFGWLASQRRGRGEPPLDPDAIAALRDAADALEEAIGHEITARAKGEGIVAELHFDDVRDAHALARRLRKRSS